MVGKVRSVANMGATLGGQIGSANSLLITDLQSPGIPSLRAYQITVEGRAQRESSLSRVCC